MQKRSWPSVNLLVVLISLVLPTMLRAQQDVALPAAKVGVMYELSLPAEGGLAPLHWKVVEGDLPAGIELSTTGELKGTPASARQQPYLFVVEVADSEQPPQRVIQQFSLVVVPAELRFIVHPPTLPPRTPAKSEWVRPVSSIAEVGVAKPISYALARKPRWVVPLPESIVVPAARPSVATETDDESRKQQVKRKDPLDPGTFMRVYEDTKTGKRLSLYEPVQTGTKKGLQLTSDHESTIILVPDPLKMGDEPVLNKLYITAKLTSGDSNKDVVVSGYAEVGKDKASMAGQSGTAFQSAANVEAMIFNMAYTVGDILKHVYFPPREKTPAADSGVSAKLTFEKWLQGHNEIDFQDKQVIDVDSRLSKVVQSKNSDEDSDLQRIRDRFRLYQPEIQAISDFFVRKENLEIVEKVGVEVFWIDRDSLEQIAQQYKDNIEVAFDVKSTADARAHALQDLLERTKLVYKDFGDFRREVRDKMRARFPNETHTTEEWNNRFETAILIRSGEKRRAAFDQLKSLLATGSISLTDNQAKDGDRLTVTVESLPSNSSSGGIPVVFEIAIKKLGAKIQWSPSLLFVRRLGVSDAEATPPAGSTAAPLNRVNFAPSPGMTFGVAYFKRGSSGWNKFVRGLSPGIGMNVSFMNYDDPTFNLATTQFVNTSGTNVQVGAGVIGSLFDNKLQVSYGWNLNVERRRNYFGIGFGFIEIGKEVAKYVTK